MSRQRHSGLSSRAIIGAFFLALEQRGSMWTDPLMMKTMSDQASEEYKWLGMAPMMREWIGGRQAKGLRENGFTVENKKFEATLEEINRISNTDYRAVAALGRLVAIEVHIRRTQGTA